MTSSHMTSTSGSFLTARRVAMSTIALGLLLAPMVLAQTTSSTPQATPAPKPAAKPAAVPPKGAKSFATAQAAADALIHAASTFDEPALIEMFGPDNKDLVATEDEVRDKSYANRFAELATQGHTVVVNPSTPSRATVQVGPDHWPLPVPLVKVAGKWYFDAKAGRDEILFRRVGANELDTIEICRGFVEAQKQYALDLHDDSHVHQYAQRIISTPGKQDGLFWRNADGSEGGPLSEAVAKAIAEGYTVETISAYHGYIFQVLKGQGPAAPLGELDYVIHGAMIGGFALLATPAEYAVTGVQTFIVDYDGIVYQKDLGPDSVTLAKQIDRYNPDKTWHRTNDAWVK
jgi:Protein of unknown function (DUF2950)